MPCRTWLLAKPIHLYLRRLVPRKASYQKVVFTRNSTGWARVYYLLPWVCEDVLIDMIHLSTYYYYPHSTYYPHSVIQSMHEVTIITAHITVVQSGILICVFLTGDCYPGLVVPCEGRFSGHPFLPPFQNHQLDQDCVVLGLDHSASFSLVSYSLEGRFFSSLDLCLMLVVQYLHRCFPS